MRFYCNSFSDMFSDHQRTVNDLKLKLYLVRLIGILKVISKFQNVQLSSMAMSQKYKGCHF